MSGQFELLKQRRFAPFFATQFLGAMNDNVFKVAFTGLVTYHTALFEGVDAKTAAFLISAIFIAPFVLFSATSGQISDKYDKARVMRWVKNLEIAIMAAACLGFVQHSAMILYAATFLMGLHSTLFGPVKFAYMPQHLSERELTGGNGLVEMGTFVAILIGTLAGGMLADIAPNPAYGHLPLGLACVALAVLGRVVVQGVPTSPAEDPNLRINWNPISETWRNLKLARETRSVFLSLLGISWLWFFGATFLTSFFNFAKDVLGGDQSVVSLLLALFSVGIGVGSLLCERMSRSKVEIGLVPFGAIGMTVFAVDLYFASRGLKPSGVAGIGAFLANSAHWRVIADLVLLAMFAGFYSVPLYALIQSRSLPSHRARIIGANNILNALFMIASAVLGMIVLGPLGWSIPELFLITGILNALVAIYIFSLVPEFLMRFLAWLLVNTVYRVREHDLHHIPEEGAAVIVCNHVSFADAVLLMAASPRPIRFVMDHQIFKVPVLSFVFRHARAIPIAPRKEDPAMMERAFDEVSRALREGELVGIFPEGRITDNGELYPFKPGITQILERDPVPVIPVALRGMWGSFFSRKYGRAMSRLRGLLSKVEVVAGPAVAAADATPQRLQAQVQALRGTAL